MKSDALTPAAYLAELPVERRRQVARVRAVVRKHAPKGLAEVMSYGMIGWVVPLEKYPDTYNREPLMYVGLAAQKNYLSLYLMCVYADGESEEKFRARWRGAKKLNMGKSCVRFTSADDLDLDLIAETIESFTVDEFVALARRVWGRS